MPTCGGMSEHRVGSVKVKWEMGNGKVLGQWVVEIGSFAATGEKLSAGSLCEATPSC
jgi:hypothetical protein